MPDVQQPHFKKRPNWPKEDMMKQPMHKTPRRSLGLLLLAGLLLGLFILSAAPAAHAASGSAFAAQQSSCLPGTYDDGSGCVPADPGYFVDTAGATQQTACSLGRFQPNAGSTFCLIADPGSFVDVSGAAAQTACAVGTYQPAAGSTFCLIADPGSFVDVSGAAAQTACAPGTYQPASGSIACLDADSGSFVDTAGAVAQTACPIGRYQPNSGSDSCLTADPGSFVDVEGAAQQTACAIGRYQPNSESASCLTADPGYFVDITGAAQQSACQPGTFQDQAGQQSCVPAAPGSFTSQAAATEVSLCLPGSYQPDAGQTACLTADAGYFVDVSGATAQTMCAPGFTSPAGATECTLMPTGGFPQTAVLDDFNRADGRVGANWAISTRSRSYRIDDEQLAVRVGGALAWRDPAFGVDQEAFVTFSSVSGRSRTQGLWLKSQSANRSDLGAIFVVYDARAGAVRVSTLRTGHRWYWPILTSYGRTAAAFADGDQLGARALADGTVEVYQNGSLLTTVTLDSGDQAFFNDKGGRIGLWTLAARGGAFDDFGGGDVSLP
jgi:hypothetical protein